MARIQTRLFSIALPLLLADMGPKCGGSSRNGPPLPPPEPASAPATPDAAPAAPDAAPAAPDSR